MQKFKALVHYIIAECDDPDQLGSIRLNKVLWFSDVTAYRMDGKPITNEKYVKQKFGPVPKRIWPALRELEAAGRISITEPEYTLEPWRFESLNDPDTRSLTNRQKNITSAVLNGVLGRTANEASEMSHDASWHAASLGEEIPLFATLTAPGEIGDDVLAWATDWLDKREEASA